MKMETCCSKQIFLTEHEDDHEDSHYFCTDHLQTLSKNNEKNVSMITTNVFGSCE